MSSINCARCGAEMSAGARFCRQCGQPVPAPSASSVLEAETRTFAPPREPATPTQHINSPLTGPAYMEPGQMPFAPAPVTKSLEPSGSLGGATKVLLAGLVLILLIAAISLAAMKILSSRNSRPETPGVTVPEIPPPPPPPPPASGGPASTGNSLVYPGAETVLDVTKADGHVLQLRTHDPVEKVVNWYTEKIRPTETVKVPGSNMTVLRGETIKAVITATGTETSIIIKQGGEE
jgi:hypothetical protein